MKMPRASNDSPTSEGLEAVTEGRFWKCGPEEERIDPGESADRQFHPRDQLHENIIGRI
jgi:hypothetical protein